MARIAIVGAGVSGLTSAWLLARDGHDVTLFEAGATAGGHTCTVPVELPEGTHQVDMGFIVLNDRNYPLLHAMLAELGVATAPSDMSFAVTDGEGGFEYASTSAGGLFARRRHLLSPRFLRMVADVRRFQRESRALLETPGDGPSLGDYLSDGGYSRWFVDRLLVPQASAVWSADPAQMWTFPAKFLVRFFANHGMLTLTDRPQWSYVRGGSQTYVRAILAELGDRVRVGTPVDAVHRHADGVVVTPRGGLPDRFDDVVLATHSDQALALLADPTEDERRILGAIPYADNEAVLHTDRSLLPRRRAAWASWVYHLLDESTGHTTVTYLMNRLQALDASREICVTLNRTAAVDPATIHHVRHFSHPVFTPEGMRAQTEHATISGAGRTHFCGAYWRWGFHEDGVWSAHRVRDAIAARPAAASAPLAEAA